jgi:hypothetical protein
MSRGAYLRYRTTTIYRGFYRQRQLLDFLYSSIAMRADACWDALVCFKCIYDWTIKGRILVTEEIVEERRR